MLDEARPRRRVEDLLRDAQGKVDLKCLNRAQVIALVQAQGGTEHQGLRVYKQVWQGGVQDWEAMVGVAKPLRRRLAQVAYLHRLQQDHLIPSADGTLKVLWRLEDGGSIESVLIPDGDRLTLCVSSQLGCAMACTFCLTGDLGLTRHLKASEIAGQLLQTQRELSPDRRITNMVLMGMGEPLHNLTQLVPALENCLDDHGLNLSHRKITVSTVGLVPKLAELAAALPVNLAVSLNATTEEARRRIMPVTRKWSMAELLEACRNFPLPSGKRITFEYVMFAGENDTLEDAARLFDLLQGIPAKVNLIPYNENPDRDLRRPTPEVVKAFQDHLVRKGLSTSVRSTRGIEVSAACGQLGKARQQLAAGLVPAAAPPPG